MKLNTQVLVALFLGVFLLSCGSESPASEGETTAQIANTKWTVHAEMMVHLRTAEQLVTEFNASEGADYAVLAGDLVAALNLLTSNCTMTGEAHAALHDWLLPYIELVNNLVDSEDDASSEQLFHDVEAAFVQFNRSFE